MRKILIGLGLLAVLTVAAPRPADAHVSIGIGLPGFGVFLGAPAPPVVYAPPPIVYSPPVYYGPPVVYGPPAYYQRPVYYRPGWHDRGRHRGWYKHRRRGWD